MSTTADELLDGDREDRRPRTVRVTVNRFPVELPDREVTGVQIKQAAIAQGVAIQASFQLSVRRGRRYEVVGDADVVKVKRDEEFLAVAPDDNS
jgi:hypothetical protein